VGVKIGIVGAGRVARFHASAISQHEEAELVAVSDVSADAAQEFARQWGCGRVGSTIEDIAGDIDGLIICSPSALHADHAREAMRVGVGVLVEKPFASSPEQAVDMIRVSREHGAVLLAGQVARHFPIFQLAYDAIAAGDIGQPVQIIERRLTNRSDNFPWWQDLPAFLVSHWGSHSIDLVCYLLGDRASHVICQGNSVRSLFGVIDDFSLQMVLQSGARFSSLMSFSSRLEVHDLVIIGTAATLSFECYRSAWLDGKKILELSQDDMMARGFESQIDEFVRALRGELPLRGNPDSVIAGLEAIQAAEKSVLGAGLMTL